ncbi:MAG: BlaI/MecI/CopY family transcriptional regulator [Phycisphaeraceae bacterium]|nr:BlaI/MecI/CopY family transcriptional regulator [Phycisphaeraceae bacterium]
MAKLAKISDAEWRVMRVLWEKSPRAASEVVEALEAVTDWSPKTVQTLLNRLVKKGAVGFEKQGRAHHYFPKVKQTQCVLAAGRSFVQRVFGGAAAPMLAHFIEEADLSAEEIEELKRILDKKGQ